MAYKARVQNKHDIEENWNKATNFIPLDGEMIVQDPDETHAESRVKFGDGISVVIDLPFADPEITDAQIDSLWTSGIQAAEEVGF